MRSFYVPGPPKGKGRPQFCRKTKRAYTPKGTRAYENRIAFAYRTQCGEKFQGPVWVEIMAVFNIPKSWTKAKKRQAVQGELFPKRPDIDNIAKAVLDGLNHVAYDDDSSVVMVTAFKDWDTELAEGLFVTISSVEERVGRSGRKEDSAKGVQ